jgi:hypothetical protein
MRLLPCIATVVIAACASQAQAAEPCQLIHGRAHYYSGDGQFRIWHIGTQHEFGAPNAEAQDWDHSWDKIMDLLQAGTKTPTEIGDKDLFADFVVCPIEPFRKGAVQFATVRKMYHPRVVPVNQSAKHSH